MDEQRVILNDGTIIPGGHAYLSEGKLWLKNYNGGMDIMTVAGMFLNPAKTAVITYEHSEVDVFEGYTVCTMMMVDGDGNMTVKMEKGA